jgi:hypothetical protein
MKIGSRQQDGEKGMWSAHVIESMGGGPGVMSHMLKMQRIVSGYVVYRINVTVFSLESRKSVIVLYSSVSELKLEGFATTASWITIRIVRFSARSVKSVEHYPNIRLFDTCVV